MKPIQLHLFETFEDQYGDKKNAGHNLSDCDLKSYDHYIVATSGGKDSFGCIAYLLMNDIPKNKIELWHHCIDGKQRANGSHDFMDWPVTEDYVRRVAAAFGIRLFFSWKQGGFKREMLRQNALTAPNHFEAPDPNDPDNIIECSIGGVRGKKNTRLKFPQVCADLKRRWCSAYLKIDVCTAAINNQPRFLNKRALVLTGERAEESPGRAKYKAFEPDRSDRRYGKKIVRHVDHLRPVHQWDEQKVWDAMKEFKLVPHPCYRLGWNRLSCISCIFGSRNQWASIYEIWPQKAEEIYKFEREFGFTIHREKSVMDQINEGSPYPDMDPELVKMGLSMTYEDKIFTSNWQLPAGAFGENVGPN